jgi:hypothetical protein
VFLDTTVTSIVTTAVNTALSFLPAPNTRYEIEVRLLVRSVATTTGVRYGVRWPTAGVLQNGAWMVSPNNATAIAQRNWGNTSLAVVNATGFPAANQDAWAGGFALLVTGASVTGSFIITLQSEIAGSEVQIEQNSFIRYREI